MAKVLENKTQERPTEEQIQQLVQRAEQGDQTVLPALRKLLDESPAVWNEYGNLALQAECSLVKLAAGSNLMLSESLVRKLAALKSDIAGPSPSPLERLLSERIAACWLQTAYFDAVIAQAHGVSRLKNNELRKLQDSSHRRFLTATKTLATVRRLLRPPLTTLDLLGRPKPEANGSTQNKRLRPDPILNGVGHN